MVGYEDHLRRTQQDFDSRWENVEELINFAAEAHTETDNPPDPDNEGAPGHVNGENGIIGDITPLRAFLQTSMLSTDTSTQDDENANDVGRLPLCSHNTLIWWYRK